MAFETVDAIAKALAAPSRHSRVVLDKASLANQVAGRYCSMWRATGMPGQGAIPTTPAVCTHATPGAVSFTQQVAPAASNFGQFAPVSSNNNQGLDVHDRLAHMGGLLLNVTTSQATTGMDLAMLGVSAERIGEADYSDVQWWLEVYTDGGATDSNATINVTFDDGTTGNLNPIAVGGTIRAGNRFGVDALRTTAQQGLNIRGINSVINSASTGTAGNFGFTVTRPRFYAPMWTAGVPTPMDWAALGLALVPNGACIEFMVMPSTTSSGTLRGGGKIIHG